MRAALFVFLFFFGAHRAISQQLAQPLPYQIETAPDWAQEMYKPIPNLFVVDSLYKRYFDNRVFQKNYHTQYFKHWRKKAAVYADDNGWVKFPTQQELAEAERVYREKRRQWQTSGSRNTTAVWTPVGPLYAIQSNGNPGHDQANIYSVDFCAAVPEVMYCGTEPGEVYRSSNGGDFWEPVTMRENFNSGVSAIEAHPVNPDVVLAGSYHHIKKSTTGGQEWTTVLSGDLGVNEILIHPIDTQIVLAACNAGLYRSVDGGDTWGLVFPNRCYDIKPNAGNPNMLYLVRNNPAQNSCEFLISDNLGGSWAVQSNGWYSSSAPERNDEGARIGVTPADPNRVYAYLIGQSKDGDMGFIGVLRSNDGGQSWTLPNPPYGGPYSPQHPNLGAINPVEGGYWQGFYNCAIMVSNTDPDKILIGGLNLWSSQDGGATYTPLGGYQGNQIPIHVDMQDFRALGNYYWITTDGGIYRSTDFFQSAANSIRKSDGLRASDYWGFGSGWNEDVLVGGLYHNGNLGYHENYGPNTFMNLGGGEAPTGYVNPGFNRKTYFSDVNGCLMPATVPGELNYFSFGIDPNESYFAGESSELEFHPDCYNIAFTGKDHQLWKTTDGGASFTLLHSFGDNPNSKVFHIEISRRNPQVMYVAQAFSGSSGRLWKTTDGGANWSQLVLPPANSRLIQLALNPLNDNELWIGYVNGVDGKKVYKTADGGAAWTNLSTPALNGERVHNIVHIGGADGSIYVFTDKTVYYRNNAMADWIPVNEGLPEFISTQSARPFYRDGKIRLASYGKGIWESPVVDTVQQPVAKAMVDKLVQTVICQIDSFYFEDYSILNHAGASWSWTFEGGQPATSSLRNPVAYFSQPGEFLVTLTVTDGTGQSDTDSLYVSIQNYDIPSTLQEGFQANFPPTGFSIQSESAGGEWSLNTSIGGYGQSTQCAYFDNYYIDSQGSADDLRMSLDLAGADEASLIYDIAYTLYGYPYVDTLAILVSADCGATFEELYRKGGEELATAPATTDYFTPTNEQWRTDTLDLSAYAGSEHLIVAFRNLGRYGNVLYIDNINLQIDTLVVAVTDIKQDQISVYPNPVSRSGILNVFQQWPGNTYAILYDSKGGQISRQDLGLTTQVALAPYNLTPGVYLLGVYGESRMQFFRIAVD